MQPLYCGSGAFRMNGLSDLPASLDGQLRRNSVGIHERCTEIYLVRVWTFLSMSKVCRVNG